MEQCEKHGELMRDVGMILQAKEEHGKQLSNIFEKLKSIQTAVDQNCIRAENRDKALVVLQECVNLIDYKIENGLRSEVLVATKNVKELKECIEHRRIIRDENAKRGIRGFVTMGWIKFRDQSSFIFVTGTIISMVWFLLWILSKTSLFSDGPIKILKFFGIG